VTHLRSITTTGLAFACTVALLVGVSARHADPTWNVADPKVADRVAAQAVPFPLQDVRLLDGLFREAMLRDQSFLLDLDPDRLLHDFRVNVGLPSSAKPLGGWEAPDVELRGHSIGHYLSALALMYASTGDTRFKTRGDLMVAELAKVQAAAPAKGYHRGYLSAFPEEFIDRVETRQRVWAPYYTLHKIMAGLLDMYQLAGNQQALDVLQQQADWVKFRQDRLTREQQQAMLMTEHGGMIEVLANLYAVTGDPEHLRLAKTFDHDFLFNPLASKQDTLNGLHANTQIPKIIGVAREYELTADPRYHDIATFFWERVAKFRSYANGGHSDGESFFPIERFSHHLSADTSETCNTYNMLKLSRHLFEWAPSAETMDFYEKGLYNHILASQDPATGMMIYYCPLKPGAYKSFSTPDNSFWCCVGTGMENHAKYPDTIYFHDPGNKTLYVNLFIPSELTWKDSGLSVKQQTRFPDEDTTRLTFTAAKPTRLAVKVRYPSWVKAGSGFSIAVNGKPETLAAEAKPGSYVAIEREWKTGDTMQVRLPMSLRLEPMPDDPHVVAVLYGPILLAGDLGKEGLDQVKRYGPSAPTLGRIKTPTVPAFVTANLKAGTDASAALLPAIKPVAGGTPLTFKTAGLGKPDDVTLMPFYKASDIRYRVYWNTYAPADWEKHEAERAATEAHRHELGSATIDSVAPGANESESAHHYQNQNAAPSFFEGKPAREARPNGWFSYDLNVSPNQAVTLVCTYRGSEGRRRIFDILIDGEKIATETLAYHPTELFDVEYAVPETLTKGKTHVTVKFQPQPESATAAIFDVRIVRR
jgi:DUF1680 family protein